jgi:dienelactone hydrolase
MECKPLHGFEHFQHRDDRGRSRCVYKIGNGPPIILMHELPGMGPECVTLAGHFAGEGFTVYLPLLFGRPGHKSPRRNFLRICISREFHLWSKSKHSVVTDWLRSLARFVHEAHAGSKVGVVGMCFSGGYVLAMMDAPFVGAPILSQPALPLGRRLSAKRALGVAPSELEAAKARRIPVVALRFKGDTICTADRMNRLKCEFGTCLRLINVDPPADKPNAHSVLTEEWQRNPNASIEAALVEVVRFLKNQTGGTPDSC